MIILGIDPGTAAIGYALLDSAHSVRIIEAGLVRIRSKVQKERIQELYTGLTDIIGKYTPDVCAIERLFFVKNVKTGIAVAESRGVILLTAAQADLSIYEYTPLEIKQAVVGYGRAEKNQVQQMVKMLLQLDFVPQPDDAADALAVAICHAHSARYEQLSQE